jgi:membrane-associated protease RseP (regulator of RpoE activity)
MYPKCVTSRDENQDDDYISEEPTSAQIDVLTKTILPAIKFSSSSKPMKVPGGWAITGNHKFDNGDELLDAIDKEISKTRPNLMEQITVLYTPSYGPMNGNSIGGESLDSISIGNMLEEETLELFAETEPILYITGPDIVRKPNRVGLTLTSIAGIATSWYLSVYPFLLNDQIASRVDADLKLVEANLQPDLSYLTEYSVPLFLSFIGLQLIHEAAHRLVAMSKDVKLSVPVFVPSFITGITSSVMTFKTLPKNKNDMFDIAAAGPLAGVVASCIALVIGAKLTLISDPSMLPALPLDILRQSTLGGAIVDNIISGSLFIPEGAPSAGINIPLHPLAIAGYTSLIVNALALLPIGSKLIKLDCFALLCLSVRLMHE